MEDNVLPHLASILREAGQAHRNQTVDILRGEASSEAIAAILGIPISEVVARRGHVDSNGRCLYRGVEMRPMDIVSSERRFAPDSLRRQPIHRASWMLRQLPFCPVSWQPLIHRCVCGERQDWVSVRDITHCRSCTTALMEISVEQIAEEWRPALQLYADLLSCSSHTRKAALSRFPEDVATLAPGHLVDLILALVPVAETRIRGAARSPSVWRDQPMLMSTAIAKVVTGMLSGRNGFFRMLGKCPREMEPRFRQLRRMSSLMTGRARIALPEPVVALLDATKAAAQVPGFGEDATLDFSEAEAVLGRSRSALRADRRAGSLRTAFRIRRGEILPVLDRQEVERIASQRNIGLANVGRVLGVPPYAVAQMADAGVLQYAEHPFVWKTKGLRILEGEDVRLLDALRGGATKLEQGETVSLYSVLRCVGGRQKPYGQIFSALLTGKINYELSAGVAVTSRILVRRCDIAWLIGVTHCPRYFITFPAPTEYSQMDACDVLNLHARDRGSVLRVRHSVRKGNVRIPVDAIDSLARVRVSLTELSARTGLHYKKVIASLGPRPDPFGWERVKACAMLGLSPFS